MQTHELMAHPDSPPGKVRSVRVRWQELTDRRLMLRYRVDGSEDMVIPPEQQPRRADELWQSTCCELFLYDGGGKYREFNFSPSSQWAAYGFSGYRSNMARFDPRRDPDISSDRGGTVFVLTAFISLAEIERAECAAISAVIEETGGRKSYWALGHGGPKPDFHDPACFRLQLAAARIT